MVTFTYESTEENGQFTEPFYEGICWFCEQDVHYRLRDAPKQTTVFCGACRKSQGTVTWLEMDSGVWIPMPSMREVPVPESKRVYYTKKKIPAKLRWDIWERDDYTCKHCGKKRELSIDHIIPESKGGTLDPDNLQTLCKSCNSRKGTRIK